MADSQEVQEHEIITLESLAERLDVIGNQMNWLLENLQSLFVFLNQMSQNGGGLRGMMTMLRGAQQVEVTEATNE